MKYSLSGTLAIALVFFLSACGQDKAAFDSKSSVKGQKQDKAQAVAETPVKADPCDFMSAALASQDGWVAVKRGKDEYLAKSVAISPSLVPFLKQIDNQFDEKSNCVQLLKGKEGADSSKAFLEIVPESCGADGVIGEERSHSLRMSIGKMIPAAAATPAETPAASTPVKKEPAKSETPAKVQTPAKCMSSNYPLLFSNPKSGQKVIGALEVKAVETRTETQGQEQSQGKGKGRPEIQVKISTAYQFTLLKLCSSDLAGSCKAQVSQGHIQTIILAAQQANPAGEQGQGKVPQQGQQVQKQPETPVKQEQKKPETPVKQEQKKPETPVKQEQKKPETPVKQEQKKPETPVKQEQKKPETPVKQEQKKPETPVKQEQKKPETPVQKEPAKP